HDALPISLGLNDSSLSRLWRRRIEQLRRAQPDAVLRLHNCVQKVLRRHPSASRQEWSPKDITEIAHVLSLCGCSLGEQIGRSRVFPQARFRFGGLPTYQCGVEFRRTLKRFDARRNACQSLPRAVVFTFRNQPNFLPRNVDHFSLETLKG